MSLANASARITPRLTVVVDEAARGLVEEGKPSTQPRRDRR